MSLGSNICGDSNKLMLTFKSNFPSNVQAHEHILATAVERSFGHMKLGYLSDTCLPQLMRIAIEGPKLNRKEKFNFVWTLYVLSIIGGRK